MLDRSAPDQLAYYQPGIGTMPPPGLFGRFKKWIITKVDLAFALLLHDHVESGYRFLMRYYEPGDKIYIFGFSRGAYTARVLAGMLHKVGLLSSGNEELIPFAWAMYKKKVDDPVYRGFRDTFSREVGIYFLGLWDTVSSVGWATHPDSFQYTRNNPSVSIVRHAVALDERRRQFVQNLWTDKPPLGQDAQQVWFVGVHSDVGGGYIEQEAGLSKIALKWMVGEAEGRGLRLDAARKKAIIPDSDTAQSVAPNPLAIKHESLKGWWCIVEWIPIPLPRRDPTQNYQTRWIVHAGGHRFVPANASLHASVFERRNALADYRPPNIPTNLG
jgi:uncharacterized protein (DUF2235 family)